MVKKSSMNNSFMSEMLKWNERWFYMVESQRSKNVTESNNLNLYSLGWSGENSDKLASPEPARSIA